jgi:hypothetical protein
MPVHAEVILAAAYAIFLFVAAKGLEWFGRHSHRRSGQFRVAGFTYHKHLDAWQCPEGHHLQRLMDHPHARRVRYRAPAHICNGCPYKANCTDSDDGREIELSAISWVETEAGRFHRGLGFVLLVLAGLILLVEWIRFPSGVDAAVLSTNFAIVALSVVHHLRAGVTRH